MLPHDNNCVLVIIYLQVDVPLSYGLVHVSQPSDQPLLNTVELYWDPVKEAGVYIKVRTEQHNNSIIALTRWMRKSQPLGCQGPGLAPYSNVTTVELNEKIPHSA